MASAQTARSGGLADDPLPLCLGIKFAMDSLLEGGGFELSVPRRERSEALSGTGTVMEVTKVRLEAVAYLPVPMVRIHFPPAKSLQTIGPRLSTD